MGRAVKNNRVRSAHCNSAAKATSISGHSMLKQNNDCNGRNPFFQFLAYFRKCSNNCLGHLPSDRVTLIAGKVWNYMSLSEKEPLSLLREDLTTRIDRGAEKSTGSWRNCENPLLGKNADHRHSGC